MVPFGQLTERFTDMFVDITRLPLYAFMCTSMCINIDRHQRVYRVTFASFVCIAGLCQAFVPALHMNTYARIHISLHMSSTCLAHVHTQVYKHVCTYSYSHLDTYRLILLYACPTYGNAHVQTYFYVHVSAKQVCFLSVVTSTSIFMSTHVY